MFEAEGWDYPVLVVSESRAIIVFIGLNNRASHGERTSCILIWSSIVMANGALEKLKAFRLLDF